MAWQALSDRLAEAGGRPLLVWISLPPEEILSGCGAGRAPRDAAKLADGSGYAEDLAALAAAPAVPHLRSTARARCPSRSARSSRPSRTHSEVSIASLERAIGTAL